MTKKTLNKTQYNFKTRDQFNKELVSKFNHNYFVSKGKNLVISNKDIKARSSYLNSNYANKEVLEYLKNPTKNQKQLILLSRYLYSSNSLYKWVVDTVSNMGTYNWVMSYDLYSNKRTQTQVKKKYRDALRYVNKLKLETILDDVFKVALTEDWYYAYQMETDDSFYLYKFDPIYCQPSSINPDGTYNFALDFTYFYDKESLLSSYPKELQRKYLQYKNGGNRWIEIDTKYSFCLKFNSQFKYTMPFYATLFPSLNDLDFYKDIKKDRAENEILQLFHQKIPVNEKGFNEFAIEPTLASEFHSQLNNAVPERSGVVTSPMDITAVQTKTTTKDSDYVKDGYRDFYTDSGLPQNLSNTDSATSVGLKQSIIVIEQILFIFYRKIEQIINRKLKENFSQDSFSFKFLDISSFNKVEKSDQLLKSAQNGINILHYASSMGSNPHEFLNNVDLENDVLDLVNKLNPIKTSYTLSAEDSQGGAPSKNGDISNSTQTNIDNDTDDNR